jgi:hypothetical protein
VRYVCSLISLSKDIVECSRFTASCYCRWSISFVCIPTLVFNIAELSIWTIFHSGRTHTHIHLHSCGGTFHWRAAFILSFLAAGGTCDLLNENQCECVLRRACRERELGEKNLCSALVCVTMRAPLVPCGRNGARTRLVYVPLIGAEVIRRMIFYFVRHVARHRDSFTQKITGSVFILLWRAINE